MIFYDGTRITAGTFRELFRFCEKKRIPEYLVESVSGMVICHLQVAKYKQIVSRSTGVKSVDADEFNDVVLKMSKTDLKNAIQAYRDVQIEKTALHSQIDTSVPKRAVNGKKYVQVKWRKPTGERELFLSIAEERRGEDGILRSEIDGSALIDNPNHHLWVNQFLHCVPKSLCPDFRLRKDNIFLGTVSQHRLQTDFPDKCKQDSRWDAFFKKQSELRQEYELKFKK
jgi:hypothetical protein